MPDDAPLRLAVRGGGDPVSAAPGAQAANAIVAPLLLAVNTAVAREALEIGVRAGLDAGALLRLLLKGSGANAVLERWVADPASRDAADGDADLLRDVRRAEMAARRADHPLLLGALAHASLLVSRQAANVPGGAAAQPIAAPIASAPMPARVGVVGLGNMGRPMARNLAARGHAIVGCDVSPTARDIAARDGIRSVANAAALAPECDVVLVMVWDDDALRDAVLGPRGVLAGERVPACIVDLSTTSVDVSRAVGDAVAARGGTFLDGAVIGGGVAALQAGRSPIVLAGARAAFDRYAELLAPLGSRDYVGGQGNAKAVKIVNNFLVGIVTASNAEALSLGVAMGADVGELVRSVQRGPATSHVLESYMGRYVRDGVYGDGLIGHRLMAKDLQLAAELAESLGCPAIYPRVGQQLYLACARALGAERAFPSAFEYFRRSAGSPTARDDASATKQAREGGDE